MYLLRLAFTALLLITCSDVVATDKLHAQNILEGKNPEVGIKTEEKIEGKKKLRQ